MQFLQLTQSMRNHDDDELVQKREYINSKQFWQ